MSLTLQLVIVAIIVAAAAAGLLRSLAGKKKGSCCAPPSKARHSCKGASGCDACPLKSDCRKNGCH